MKTKYKIYGILAAIAAATILSCMIMSCEQLEGPAGGPAGKGTVVLTASTGGATNAGSALKTYIPKDGPEFSRYVLVFSKGDTTLPEQNVTPEELDGGYSLELDAGTWTVAVTAYREFTIGDVGSDASAEEYAAAAGTADVEVSAGTTEDVTVNLAPIPIDDKADDPVNGFFTYEVSFPDKVEGTLTLTPWGENEEQPATLTSSERVTEEKAPGYYSLSISLTKTNGGVSAARTLDVVHIYSGLETVVEITFEDDDFPHQAPELLDEPVVTYDTNDLTITVTYSFNTTVNVAGTVDGWTVEVDEEDPTKLNAKPSGGTTAGTPLTLTLTVENAADSLELDPVTVMPVTAKFARPTGDTAVSYTLVYYDKHGAAGLKTNGDEASYYYVPDTETGLRATFNAIYTPNAPGSVDAIDESNKTTVLYDDALSGAVLPLFTINVAKTAGDDAVELKGTDLPSATIVSGVTASNTNLIVIDIGLPDQDNKDLPTFRIPAKGLGAENYLYGYIRLRVNRGANMVILAGNSGYINVGVGNPCDPGYFNNGCVEVMDGGKLRDGAFEGFPLGSNAVILNRLNSYLGIGPEEDSEDAVNEGVSTVYNKYYKGWLIGPAGSDARILWGTGDQTGSYIEVRPGKLAISASVTVKKSMGLIYSVWFVNGPTVTIDAADHELTIDNMKGLFSNSDETNTYVFYGTAAGTGGQNPGNSTATIIVKPGNVLHKLFLTGDLSNDSTSFISATDVDITITNKGSTDATPKYYPDDNSATIFGYLNWDYPVNN
ncbi:MAG: hypothetical protein LBD44_01570 [Spirochaetaceae bacterium]|jgi:hypothetical protein|nr:hypothetical protein [Spirochaetaceae bacterium]